MVHLLVNIIELLTTKVNHIMMMLGLMYPSRHILEIKMLFLFKNIKSKFENIKQKIVKLNQNSNFITQKDFIIQQDKDSEARRKQFLILCMTGKL